MSSRGVLVRTAVSVFLSAVLCAAFLHGQPVIDNPAKPLSPNAGRVLKLTEIWRISDEGSGFYFKNPGNLRIAINGNFILQDENQILMFSPAGKLLGNLYKAGQGPGELSKVFASFLDRDDIIIQDYQQNKVVRLSADGVFKEQILVKPNYSLIGILDRSLILYSNDVVAAKNLKSTPQNVPYTIVSLSRDGALENKIFAFNVRWFSLGRMLLSLDPFATVQSGAGDRLYVVHTEDYLVKVLDLTKGALLRSFKRNYPRIKHKPEDMKELGEKRKYENDIEALYSHGEDLWVGTSVYDSNKGHMIDVFDAEGRYLDNFFLKADSGLLAVKDNALFMRETNKDGSVSVVKYRID